MAEEGKVSVLLAVAAGETESPACQETLRSIAMQSYPSSLIDLVQVQYVGTESGGRTSALNAALESATGQFMVQTEPGVSWDATKVERQVTRLTEETSADLTVHATTMRQANGRQTVLGLNCLTAYGPRIGGLMQAPWAPGAAMVKRDVSARLGAYRYVDEVLWEHAVRGLARGLQADPVDESLSVWQTEDPGGLSGRRSLFPDGPRARFLKRYLDKATPESLAVNGDGRMLELLVAGLYLMNDDLEACHAICQSFERESAPASYWHGIVHRREPDFDNARGWFGRATGFEALPEIGRAVMEVLQRALQIPDYGEARDRAFSLMREVQESGTWNPATMIDLCATCRASGEPGLIRLLEEIQEAEIRATFDWTYRAATGAPAEA